MKLPVALGLSGGAVFLFGVTMGWYGFPKMVSNNIAASVALKKGSEMRQLWEKFPEPLEFKIYLFNVTNVQEVNEGHRPMLQEVGPFFYDQYKEKVDLQDDVTDDTVSYNQRVKWIFNAAKSHGRTSQELITMPHAVLLGAIITVLQDQPGMLGLLNKAIPHLFNNASSVFITATAHDILWGGLIVNCSTKDFSAKAVCTKLKKDLQPDGNNLKFSFFGPKNDTVDPIRMRVKRGIKKVQDVGRVVAIDGAEKLKIWNGFPCNNLSGTDSTIFPPFLKPEDGIVAYAPDLCRSIKAEYDRATVYKGIPGYRYTADIGDPTCPDQRCFCRPDKPCVKKGAMDLAPCQGSPVVVTLPHFYNADKEYLQGVGGLKPIQDQHEISMEFEPITGTPLGARKRLQFCMPIQNVEKVDVLAHAPTALLPLFWVEEGLSLDQKFIDTLESNLFRTLRIMDAVKWITMLLGGGLGAAGVYLHMKRKNSLAINPVDTTGAKIFTLPPVHEDGASRY